MSCGSDDFRFPDEWITAFVDRPVVNTQIAKWWSSGCPSQVHAGDTAALVATKSGKVMGAFEVVGDPVEDRSHPTRPRLEDAAGFRPLEPGETLPGGVTAHPIGRPRRYEQPLHLSSQRALAFGDAIVEVDGALRDVGRQASGRQAPALLRGALRAHAGAVALARRRARARDARRAGARGRRRGARGRAAPAAVVPPRLGQPTSRSTWRPCRRRTTPARSGSGSPESSRRAMLGATSGRPRRSSADARNDDEPTSNDALAGRRISREATLSESASRGRMGRTPSPDARVCESLLDDGRG
jgi:hypothetical protein